jgi:hypothetical protein
MLKVPFGWSQFVIIGAFVSAPLLNDPAGVSEITARSSIGMSSEKASNICRWLIINFYSQAI